jgi:hypothetical protein
MNCESRLLAVGLYIEEGEESGELGRGMEIGVEGIDTGIGAGAGAGGGWGVGVCKGREVVEFARDGGAGDGEGSNSQTVSGEGLYGFNSSCRCMSSYSRTNKKHLLGHPDEQVQAVDHVHLLHSKS